MVQAVITSSKYLNKIRNGDTFTDNPADFATNQTGNIGEIVKAVFTIAVSWEVEGTTLSPITIPTELGRMSASFNFQDQGYAVGHVFDFIDAGSIIFNGTVTAFSTDGLTMFYTVNSGSESAGSYDNLRVRARADAPANYLTALRWKFGLLENNETFNTKSKTTEADQGYNIEGVGLGSPRDTAPVAGTWINANKDAQTGSLEVAFSTATTYEQTFEVSHVYQINPLVVEGQEQDIQQGIYPDYLAGSNSLKYVFDCTFLLSETNPNSNITVRNDSQLGAVGWFNERLNGLPIDYELISIAYTDTATGGDVDGLQEQQSTNVQIVIGKLSGVMSAGQRMGLAISYFADESDYTNTPTTLLENFLTDIQYTDGPTVAGPILQAVSTSIDSGNLVIDATIDYSVAQRALIAGKSYLLGVFIGDKATANAFTDRTLILADVNQYVSGDQAFLDSLVSFSKLGYLQHPQSLGDVPSADIIAHDEDGIILDYSFDLNKTTATSIQEVRVLLEAYKDASNSFLLDSYVLPTAQAPTSGGVQQININSRRNYPLAPSSEFALATLTTGANTVSAQTYEGALGQKIRWEDWIKNLNVDPAFYDATKPNDNRNFKSDNYSGLLGYEIRMAVVLSITATNPQGVEVSGEVKTLAGIITTLGYEEGSGIPASFDAVIETFDQTGTVNFDGRIRTDQNTLFKCTWGNALFGDGGYYIHRMQAVGELGQQIFELSSINTPLNNQPLIPLEGETLLKKELVGGSLITTCLIDYTKLGGLNWRLSARGNDIPVYPFQLQTTAENIEIRFDGAGLTSVTMLFHNTSVNIPPNQWFAYSFGTGQLRTLSFVFNDSTAVEQMKLSRQDGSGNEFVNALDMVELTGLQLLEAQNNSFFTVSFPTSINDAGIAFELFNNSLDVPSVLTEIDAKNTSSNPNRVISLYGNDNIGPDIIGPVQNIEATSLIIELAVFNLLTK
jgi:hypothetical protein